MTATMSPVPRQSPRLDRNMLAASRLIAFALVAAIATVIAVRAAHHRTDSPAAATRRYLAALTDGPGTRICRTLTPRAQTQLLALLQQNGITPDCHNAGAVRDLLDPRQITAIRRAVHDDRITTVIHGNTATARLETIEDGLTPQTMPLVRKNGRWLIDGGIG